MQRGVEELGKEKPTDSQLVVKRIALIVMEAERGKEVRLVHCWSQAKGATALQATLHIVNEFKRP